MRTALSGLERHLGTELESTHLCARREASDLAAVAAIHTAIGAIQVDVVKHVIEFELELCPDLFSKGNRLEDRGTGIKVLWPAELVNPCISEAIESGRLAPWPGSCAERSQSDATGSLEPIAESSPIARPWAVLNTAFHICDTRTVSIDAAQELSPGVQPKPLETVVAEFRDQPPTRALAAVPTLPAHLFPLPKGNS